MDSEEIEVEGLDVAGSNCTRCGKPRVAVSSHEEKLENSVVTYVEWECSDSSCQKLVNIELEKEETKRKFIKSEQEKREAVKKQQKEEKQKEKEREASKK